MCKGNIVHAQIDHDAANNNVRKSLGRRSANANVQLLQLLPD
jgi:hypothetical protein